MLDPSKVTIVNDFLFSIFFSCSLTAMIFHLFIVRITSVYHFITTAYSCIFSFVKGFSPVNRNLIILKKHFLPENIRYSFIMLRPTCSLIFTYIKINLTKTYPCQPSKLFVYIPPLFAQTVSADRDKPFWIITKRTQ